MNNTRQAYSGGRPVYIVDANRTPFLKAQGKPGPFSAADLAVAAGKALLVRQPFAPQLLDEVILGCIIPGPSEVNIARLVALRLGCGKQVPAWTVQRNCGSGMQAIDSAATDIAYGRADLVLAGGTEAMSHAPVLLPPPAVELLGAWQQARTGGERLRLLSRIRPAHLRLVSGLLLGLTDPFVNLSMGQTAEILAKRFAISREQMDAFACQSHGRLARAQDSGWLAEIEPHERADAVYVAQLTRADAQLVMTAARALRGSRHPGVRIVSLESNQLTNAWVEGVWSRYSQRQRPSSGLAGSDTDWNRARRMASRPRIDKNGIKPLSR